MKEQIHAHLLKEMEQASKGDTVFVICAVLFNLVVLAVNSAVAIGKSQLSVLVFSIFMLGSVLVTVSAIVALRNASKACNIYRESLLWLYQSEGVDKYWPTQLNSANKVRFILYYLIVLFTAFMAVCIPLAIDRTFT